MDRFETAPPPMSLQEIYKQHSTPNFFGDKGTAHSYIDEYARLLEPFRDTTDGEEMTGNGTYCEVDQWRVERFR